MMMEGLLIRTKTPHSVSDSTGHEDGPSFSDVAVTSGSVCLLPGEEDEDAFGVAMIRASLKEEELSGGTVKWEDFKRDVESRRGGR